MNASMFSSVGSAGLAFDPQNIVKCNSARYAAKIKVSNLLAGLYFSRYFRLAFQLPSGKCEVGKAYIERHLQAISRPTESNRL